MKTIRKISLALLSILSISSYAIELNTFKQMDEPFNAYGGLRLDSTIYWNELDHSASYKYEYSYSGDGRITMCAIYREYDEENNIWIGSSKDEYMYLPGGSVIYYDYAWNDVSKDWALNRQVNDTYENGLNTSTIYFTWNNSTNSLMFSSKKEYEYYDDTELLYLMTEAKWSNNKWNNTKRICYDYYENNNVRAIYEQTWNGSNWSLVTKVLQTFDESNNLVSREFFQWNSTTMDWVNLMKYTYTYFDTGTAAGKIYSETQWLWNDSQNEYIGYKNTKNTYDSNGYLIQVESQNYDDLVLWSTYYIELYERDTYGNTLSYTGGLISEGLDIHYEYTYDSNNNWVTYSDFEWNNDENNWKLTSVDSLSYDAYDNLMIKKSYNNNNVLRTTETRYYSESNFSPLTIDFDYMYTWDALFPEEWFTGDSIGIVTKINNNTNVAFSGIFALQLVSEEDNDVIQFLDTLDMSSDAIEPLNYKVVRFNGKIKVPSGNYIQTILYRNNNDEEWQIVGVTEGHENPTTFVVSAEEEYKRYIILAQRYTSSNWFYMTADLGTASTKRYQAVDAGTNILTNVTTIDLDEKYYWEIEGYKLKNGNQYSTWSSGNSAKFDAIGKDLTIQQQADGTYTFSFADGSDTRYLSLNKTTGNDYFAYYKGTTQVYKLTLVKEGATTPTAIENTSDETHHDSPIRKVIEDGQLYILLPNGTRYTATGAKVEEEMGR